MKERLVKVEQEANGLRLLLQKKIEQVSKLELEVIDGKFEYEKVKAQIENERKDNQKKDYILSDHQAVVDANKKLNEEKIDLVSRINNLQTSLDKVAKMQKEKLEAE